MALKKRKKQRGEAAGRGDWGSGGVRAVVEVVAAAAAEAAAAVVVQMNRR